MRIVENNFMLGELKDKTLKDYINLIRNNLSIFLIVLTLSVLLATVYSLIKPDIFVSSTSLKISKLGGNILQTSPFAEFTDYGMDRFINNEIEILLSSDLRYLIADALIDSLNQSSSKEDFKLLYTSQLGENNKKLISIHEMTILLKDVVSIEQKKALDIIDISAESPSAIEAAMIASVYSKIYRNYNLEINRNQLSYVRDFFERQSIEKKIQLKEAEDTLKIFQEKGRIIALDEQAQALIQQLSQFESQMNAAKIELIANEDVLKKYREELAKQDPKLADYLESVTSETYITALQNQIAQIQLGKDLAQVQLEGGIDISEKIKEYDNKITDLKQKLDEKIKILKNGIFASSPEEVRAISQKIIETEVKNQSLRSMAGSLGHVVQKYEYRFNRLPRTKIELARFQRTRESAEKLFTLIEQKYQEAMINEQSRLGMC